MGVESGSKGELESVIASDGYVVRQRAAFHQLQGVVPGQVLYGFPHPTSDLPEGRVFPILRDPHDVLSATPADVGRALATCALESVLTAWYRARGLLVAAPALTEAGLAPAGDEQRDADAHASTSSRHTDGQLLKSWTQQSGTHGRLSHLPLFRFSTCRGEFGQQRLVSQLLQGGPVYGPVRVGPDELGQHRLVRQQLHRRCTHPELPLIPLGSTQMQRPHGGPTSVPSPDVT